MPLTVRSRLEYKIVRCLPRSTMRKSIDYFAEEEGNEKPRPKVETSERAMRAVDSERHRDRSRNGE